MSPCPPPLIPHTYTILPTYLLLSPSLPMLALKSHPITILSLFPIATCLSISRLHLSMPSLFAPQLGWYTDTSLNPPNTTATPSPQTTSTVPLPPTFLALLPLTSLPPSSRGSALPFPRPPPTRPLPPHLPSAQLATPSPIPPASPSPPHFSASSCSSPSHSTSSHSRSRPTATPSTPK